MLEIMKYSGSIIEVGGNRPLLLTDPDSLWIVEKGTVDVFSVRIQEGRPHGARKYLFSTGENALLFGLQNDLPSDSTGLIAVGALGTTLREYRRTDLQQHARDPEQIHAVAIMIDDWTTRLLAALSSGLPPKEIDRVTAPGEIALDSGASLCAAENIIWVEHLAGTSVFMGNAALLPLSSTHYFPLSEESWLQTAGTCSLALSLTQDRMAADPLWTFLDAFHNLFFSFLILLQEEELSREAERIRKKLEYESAAIENALRSFLPDRDLVSRDSTGEASDPLIAACVLVGKALDIRILPPSPETMENGLRDPVSKIATRSQIRMRKVILKDRWWHTNNGPLLAFIENGQRPVALLQPEPTGYLLHDPAGSTTSTVNEQVAATLAPFAFTLYRPFPDGPVSLSKLLKFGSFKSGRDIVTVLLMGAAGGLLGLVMPLCMAVVFDSIIPMAQSSQLLQIGAALFVGALATAMFDLTRAVAMLRIEGRLDGSVQAAVMDRLLSLPVDFFRRYSVGDLTNRTMGIDAIRQLMTGVVTSSLLSGVFSVFNLVLLFYYSVSMACFAVGLVALATILNLCLMVIIVRYQRNLLEIRGTISGHVFQFITGMAKLRVSGSERKGFSKWLWQFNEQKDNDLKAGMVTAVLTTLNSMYPVFFSMVIFLLFYLKGSLLSMGAFLSFTAAFSQFLAAGIQISASLAASLSAIPLYERAEPLLQERPETSMEKEDPGALSGDIEIRNAVFRYKKDGPCILQNISLHIKKGEFVAIVGPSGSGKSTLLRVLLGFETLEEGSIYFDRQDLQTIDLRLLRRQIGVVLQNGHIMSGDIFSNIVGSNNLTVDDAWEAARKAGLENDIKDMPMGMFTVVPPGGSTISGGQQQRLLIARAMVTKPRIFFFDEATSALDNITQSIVSRSLEQFHATRLVIAHRLSTVMHADKIVVMDKGAIVESGSYDELINNNGLFCELAKRQMV